MQYPTEVKMGAHTIPVAIISEPIKKVGDKQWMIGSYHSIDRKITQFHSDDHVDMCGESFLHETIEAANDIYDLQLNHTVITSLAAALYQAFNSGKVSFATN